MLGIIKTKKNIVFIAGLVLFMSCTVFIYNTYINNNNITYLSRSSVTDVSNDRKLAGISHNIFIGKVISKIGVKSRTDILPETQFSVQLIENIKGNLNENIIVNQQGGNDNNKIVLFENDKMIEPGKFYLFATRYNEAEKWHTLIPVYGDLVIDNDTKKKELVEKFKIAFKEQIELNFKNSPKATTDQMPKLKPEN